MLWPVIDADWLSMFHGEVGKKKNLRKLHSVNTIGITGINSPTFSIEGDAASHRIPHLVAAVLTLSAASAVATISDSF
jgi:hypothetical protein